MGWTKQDRPDMILSAGAIVRFTLHYSYVPFIGVSAERIQSALDLDTPLYVSNVNESVLSTLGLSDEWNVQASIRNNTTVGQLSAAISNSLNKWYSWGVSVTDLEMQTWVPDIGPSTQTTVSLVAVAVIAVLVFLAAKKGGLL